MSVSKTSSFYKRTTALTRPLATGLMLALGIPLGMSVVTPASAQDYTSGSITGTVLSSSGKPIDGATVTIKSKRLGFTQKVETSSSGGFYVTGLATGTYTVTAEASGFKSESVANAKVAASAAASFTLVLGPVSGGEGIEQVVVTGVRQNFDFAATTTGNVINVPDLVKDIPVGRNLTSLILLSPSTSVGDRAFGSLASIGGSSVAENAYYINGLNITDTNKYLGSSTVPFDFYESVEVKTGGYAAEYGRATGGIVNSVTKSGTNEFKAAVHFNWSPNDLSSTSPDTYSVRNKLGESSNFSTTLEAGGPLIKDHLFAYGLVQYNDTRTQGVSILGSYAEVDTNKSPFYGFKLDGYINEDHHFEFTVFDTRSKTEQTFYAYDTTTDKIDSTAQGLTYARSGGISFVGKYTGRIFDWLTISAAYGVNRDRDESLPQYGTSALAYVVDNTAGGVVCSVSRKQGGLCNGQSTSTNDYPQTTERRFLRFDADFYFNLLGDHHVRAGLDREKDYLEHTAIRTGPDAYSYVYRACGSNAKCSTGTGASAGLTSSSYYVELNYYTTGGSFNTKNNAFYAEDEYKPIDDLTLNLGIRNDDFNNFTADGTQYLKLHNLWAPRLGFSYTPSTFPWEDHNGRFFGSYGAYYLPVASNTAFRQGAAETYFREYWTYTGVGTNGIPTLGTQLTGWSGAQACPKALTSGSASAGTLGCAVTSDGTVQDPTASVAHNLKATKEREIIFGYEHKIDDLWTVGVTYTHRDLLVSAEDVAVDAAVNTWCSKNGIAGCSSIWSGYNQYVIINPGYGADITLKTALPGETGLRTIHFSAKDLGYPKATRKYDDVTFTFGRAFDGVWSLNGSYTWARSRGNTEGYVNSDFEQDDAGVTQDFDQPGFTVGAYGYLPNDRRHRVKLWGSYQVTPELSLGSQVQIKSPRRQSCWGYDPTNDFINYENGYGAASHYCGGKLSPRGTALKTDWIYNVDLSARYNFEIPSGQLLSLRVDVFNVFNGSGIEKRQDVGEVTQGKIDNENYGKARQFQSPRSVRIGLDLNF